MNIRHLSIYPLIALLLLSCFSVNGQNFTDTTWVSNNYPTHKLYFSNGFDAALFQSSMLSRPGRVDDISTVRFSYFINLGTNLNYDLSKKFGVFTGIGIKNIGFIDKVKDSTIKRRVYAVGAPLGLKIGNIEKKRYLFFGGGLDIPIHYKEKGYKNRSDKKKTSEWFSDQTSFLLPYVFAGYTYNEMFLIKFQYYPGNFMNTSYSISTPSGLIYPYAGYNVNLFYISIGISPNIKLKKSKGADDIPKKMS